jgi:uncharacterized protein involved in exopolysaccharide biosynthesis
MYRRAGQHLPPLNEAAMESLRQDSVIHEMEPVVEIEFPTSPVESRSSREVSKGLAALQLLWAKRRFLFRVAVWAIAISTVIAFLIPNQYESTVRIMPPDSMNGTGTMLAAIAAKTNPELASMAGALLGGKSSGALFVDLFRSRSVQDSVVDRLNLQSVYWKRYKQDARKKLDSRTDVGEDRKSGVITITVQDRNPQLARDIAQTYVQELNRVVAQVSTSSARRERMFIEQRLVTVKSDLEDAEKQFSVFASKNTALDIKEQAKAMVESAAVLQGQLIAAQSQLQSLEQIYTPNNVRVRAARAQIEELKRQVQSLRGTDSSLTTETGNADEMYPPIRKLPLLGVEWADLYRRMKIQETVYELLNSQYELARIQEAREIPSVNVVDFANVPEKKSFPPRVPIILGLTVLSLAGAAVWIVAVEQWQQIDANDPGKIFAENVWRDAAARVRSIRSQLPDFLKRESSAGELL